MAALLDKRVTDAGDYTSFCPDALLNRSLCIQDASHEAIWFDDAPVRFVPRTLRLDPLWLEDGSPWPLHSVSVELQAEEIVRRWPCR